MRRKSSRSTVAKNSPDKPKEDKPRKTRRRRRKSTSSESDSDDEPLVKHSKSQSSDREEVEEEQSSKRSGRRSSRRTEESTASRRKQQQRRDDEKKENEASDEDNGEVDSRTEEAVEEEKSNEAGTDDRGKGKSKGKHKSKYEQTPHVSEAEMQSEISKNVQVTAQSPAIDDNVDNNVDNVDRPNADGCNNDDGDSERHRDVGNEDVNVNVLENVVVDNNVETIAEDCPAEPEAPVVCAEVVADAEPDAQTGSTEPPQQGAAEADLDEQCSCVEIIHNAASAEDSGSNCKESNNEHENTIRDKTDVEQLDNPSIETNDVPKENNSNESVADSTPFSEERISDMPDKAADESGEQKRNSSATFKFVLDDSDVVMAEPEEESLRPTQEAPVSQECVESEKEVKSEESTLRKRILRLRKKPSTEDATGEELHVNGWKPVGLGLFRVLDEISFEKLSGIFWDISLLGEGDVELEPVRRVHEVVRRPSARKVSIEERPQKVESPEQQRHHIETENLPVENIIAMNRKISIVDDSASKLNPPPSPAKNEVSEVLFITNLVRPFTAKQLKELLERTGTIREDGFWTDKIKSKCFVHYNSIEEAEATRNALHGVHWPIGNGKKLMIDYSTPEKLQEAKNPPAPPPAPPVVKTLEIAEKENTEPQHETKKTHKDDVLERGEKNHNMWDMETGKEEGRRKRSRSRDKDNKGRHSRSRRSKSPVHDLKKKHKREEEVAPQRAMDDLFRKTEATPCIYWLPLGPEEIALKQQQRLERMAEHKRRLETQSRSKRPNDHLRGGGGGGGGPYRRRY